ncbi:hypothetical protein IQ26_06103 [Mesorhizobium tianshanense]|uniref:Uncharacterized protein n=1 Tax=Mesorhizobium tianshanense TaxID=39844 RepID=A0A562MZT8_9HYPH|nr:hypothetical protein IQ26_06103 [Mesorhizobium tianshanense]
MVRPFKWIVAKVFEGRDRGANRTRDGRIEADVTCPCFLRSFVLLAPRQSAMGFL